MQIATIQTPEGQHIAVHRDGRLADVTARAAQRGEPIAGSMVELLGQGAAGIEQLARLASAAPFELALEDAELLAPIPRPGKIFATRGSYDPYVLASGEEVIAPKGRTPHLFCKMPSTVIGPHGTVEVPVVAEELVWEIELAVVIGAPARRVSVEQAPRHVAGYTIGLDISPRELRFPGRTLEHPLDEWFDFLYGKWCDSFAVLGPFVTTADEVPDAQAMRMQLDINGVRREDATTEGMNHTVVEIVSFLSSFCTLEPGDVIFTGMPAAVGEAAETFLVPGDRIDGTIEGLGEVHVTVAAANTKEAA